MISTQIKKATTEVAVDSTDVMPNRIQCIDEAKIISGDKSD